MRKDLRDLKLGRIKKEICDIKYGTESFEDMVAFGDQSAKEVKDEVWRQQMEQIQEVVRAK